MVRVRFVWYVRCPKLVQRRVGVVRTTVRRPSGSRTGGAAQSGIWPVVVVRGATCGFLPVVDMVYIGA